jgi:hypothetical protein
MSSVKRPISGVPLALMLFGARCRECGRPVLRVAVVGKGPLTLVSGDDTFGSSSSLLFPNDADLALGVR